MATRADATFAMGRSSAAANVERLGLSLLAITLIAVTAAFDVGREDIFAEPKLEYALLGSAALVVIVLIAGAWGRVVPRWADLLVAGYVAWSLLAFLVVPGWDEWRGEKLQLQGMASVLVYGIVYSAARRFVIDAARLRLIMWWVLAGVTYAAVYGVMQRLDLDPLWNTLHDGRVFSTIGQPNTLASVLVLAVPIAAFFAVRGSRPERIVAAGAFVALAAALMFSGSRGGFLATLVGFAVLASAAPRPSARALEVTAAVGLVLISVGFAAAPVREQVASTWDRATSALDSADESRRFHVEGWRVTVAMIADHPLVGVGHERFPEEFPAYRDEVLSEEGIQRFAPFRLESPHNVPLAIAVGAGLPAAIMYLALVVVLVRVLVRSRLDRLLKAALASAVAAHLVADLFVTADLTSAMIFWALLGAIASSTGVVEHRGEPGDV
ncbi:MAG: O-antigen ligase family protein [Actinomycetota bacterium]|jgi:O-antigen ligase|nr:O-antigen ligase family protein [Actinomycetota bacterium]